jgi:hypothetical protein
MITRQPEALGKSYLGKTDIIGKELNMDFLVSTPNNLIEEAKQEILKLRLQVESLIDENAGYKSTIKIFQKKISRLEYREIDLEKEFKLKIEKLNK